MKFPASVDVRAFLSGFTGVNRLLDLKIGKVADRVAGTDAANTSDGSGAASQYGHDDGFDAISAGLLAVEAFIAVDGLHQVGARDILLLSTDAHIELKRLTGRRATLFITLADGSRASFSGLVSQAALLGSEGGFARYRVRVVPWLWLLSQSSASRVWQEQRVTDIVDDILRQYVPHAAWQWSADAMAFLRTARVRSYAVQYRETDLSFLRRLLAEEGLTWRIEESSHAPSGHQLILLADTSDASALPEDITSASALGGAGIRYHSAHAREEQDSIQAITVTHTLHAALTTVLSTDYRSWRSIAASVPAQAPVGGPGAPQLERYDASGAYAWGNIAQAERHARLQQQAVEAAGRRWSGRSTVRSLRAGTRMSMSGSVPQEIGPAASGQYAVLQVTSIGINNLPKAAQESVARLLGPLPELLSVQLAELTDVLSATDCLHRHAGDAEDADPYCPHRSGSIPGSQHRGVPSAELKSVIAQALASGYGNCFDAIATDIAWRPILADGTGMFWRPVATAPGSQSAIVVGMRGETVANGANELCCDRLGRVRIRFHWQDQSDSTGNAGHRGHRAGQPHASCWVRVAQRSAGPGMGMRFLPRIGQEVLVQFIEGDIERPIIVGALYNGQGEGGIAATPGGKRMRATDDSLFAAATDHHPSAQGNLANGNSPVWHGASPDPQGHCNAAAQWGIRSKEFGGNGYNQLVFDDTDHQGRIQLKTTHAGTELNMGHLIHTADNYRGSFRGTGIELRTDAHGALRAGCGMLLTTYGRRHGRQQRDAAGDNAAGMAHLKQAVNLAKSFNDAARSHHSVALASHEGSIGAGKSVLDAHAAPMAALLKAASGMVSRRGFDEAKRDAGNKNTIASDDKIPHTTAPIIAIAAKAGIAMVAGQDIQLCNGDVTAMVAGGDIQFDSGGQERIHSGQAIGMLAGVMQASSSDAGSEENDDTNSANGLQLIAAQGPVSLQAQQDEIKIQARDLVNVKSAHGHIDWAAAKSITLSTAGGANITIENGNITVQCPGKITVHAGQKKFLGPARLDYPIPQLPKSVCLECLLSARNMGSPFALR
jgi:type VI secretion system secreted protein VgrG